MGPGMCKVSAIFAEANRLKSTARGEEAMVKLGVSNLVSNDGWRLTESIIWFDKGNDFWSTSSWHWHVYPMQPPCRAPRAYDHPRTTYMGGPFLPRMAVFELTGLFCGGAVMMGLPHLFKWWNRELPTSASYQNVFDTVSHLSIVRFKFKKIFPSVCESTRQPIPGRRNESLSKSVWTLK